MSKRIPMSPEGRARAARQKRRREKAAKILVLGMMLAVMILTGFALLRDP